MRIRKIIAPIDPSQPKKVLQGTLCPSWIDETDSTFIDIRTGKRWVSGVVVFTGTEFTENEVFARIVESGRRIESVSVLMAIIEEYLRQLSRFKIGDVVEIKGAGLQFRLVPGQRPPREPSKLPG